MELYLFRLSDKDDIDPKLLPSGVAEHCKKRESRICASVLLEKGIENLHYEVSGKPVADNCFISISHSGDMAAVCKSEIPVGVDIEKIDAERDLRKIAARFYCGKELEYFSEKPTAERFYEIWTKKEAYSKIDGGGVSEIFRGFDVLSLNGYRFTTEIADGYATSVCEKDKN